MYSVVLSLTTKLTPTFISPKTVTLLHSKIYSFLPCSFLTELCIIPRINISNRNMKERQKIFSLFHDFVKTNLLFQGTNARWSEYIKLYIKLYLLFQMIGRI